MKIRFWYIVLALVVAGCSAGAPASTEEDRVTAPEATSTKSAVTPALMSEDQERAEQTFQHLIELFSDRDHELAADLMLYKGADDARAYRATCTYDTPGDRAIVDRMSEIFRYRMDGLDHFEAVGFEKKDEPEGEWNVLSVELRFQDGKVEPATVTFLRIRNQFLLADFE